ncbi:MAG: hypothetical protein R6U04_11275 [Bacteroidales bacterium]
MILKLVVLVGLSLYLAVNGDWLFAVLALTALWPMVGLWIAIGLTILLVLVGEVWPAAILGALVIWNLIGNYFFQHHGESHEKGETELR